MNIRFKDGYIKYNNKNVNISNGNNCTSKKKRKNYEHDLQVKVFNAIDGTKYIPGLTSKYPLLSLIYAIPNQSFHTGSGYIYMYKEGVRKGMPDICLPIARLGYSSFYLELKYGKNKPDGEQYTKMANLLSVGNYCGWSNDYNNIIARLIAYYTEDKERFYILAKEYPLIDIIN